MNQINHFRAAVIEDDNLIREMIKLHLERNGFQVDAFACAESYLERPEKNIHDLVILDVVLPGMHGDELLTHLRDRKDDTPVLMLTVRKGVSFRIRAFEAGVDDFLQKPFDLNELLVRANSVIRRSQSRRRPPSMGVVQINGCRVDLSTRECECLLGKVTLSDKEINLLRYFWEHPHESLSRADILEEVWGMDVAPTPRTIDNFILKFRRLFETEPDKPRHFLSIRGRGYRFEP